MLMKVIVCYNVVEYMAGQKLEDYTMRTIGEEGEGRELTHQSGLELELSDIVVRNFVLQSRGSH